MDKKLLKSDIFIEKSRIRTCTSVWCLYIGDYMGSLANANMTQGGRVVVSVGGFTTIKDANGVLCTYALGSCLGVIVWDPQTHVGGLLHFMLPDSTLSPEKAAAKPGMFCDSGIPALISEFEDLGGSLDRAKVMLVGGGSPIATVDPFKIGEKNVAAARTLFEQMNTSIDLEDIGGMSNRTLHVHLGNGEATIKTASGTKTVTLV